MKRLLLLVIAIGQAALAGCGAMGTSEETPSEATTPPSAASPPTMTATPIVEATIEEFTAKGDGIQAESVPGPADVALVKIVLGPGGSTGWHHHPGVVLAPVKAGAVTEYDAECHKTVYKAGEGFVESNGEVHLVRNEGNVDAVLYATFLAAETPPEGLTIADAQPKNCDVE